MIGQWIGTGLDIMMVLGGRIGNKKGIRLQIGIEKLISVKREGEMVLEVGKEGRKDG